MQNLLSALWQIGQMTRINEHSTRGAKLEAWQAGPFSGKTYEERTGTFLVSFRRKRCRSTSKDFRYSSGSILAGSENPYRAHGVDFVDSTIDK